MKKLIPVIISIILCYGCSKSNTAKPASITGHWVYTGDVSKTFHNDTLINTHVLTIASSYFQFNADGTGISVHYLEGLVTQNFSYTVNNKIITFHFDDFTNSAGFTSQAYTATGTITQLTTAGLTIVFENSFLNNGFTQKDQETISMKK